MTVHLICGKLCSGKSTYARTLAQQENAVILSCDEIMTLFPPIQGDAAYAEISGKVKRLLLQKAADTARCGAAVILDWGFWGKEERRATQAFFAQRSIPCQWHYLNVSDAQWRRQIARRNAAPGPSDYLVDEGLALKCLRLFEAPDEAERQGWIVAGEEEAQFMTPPNCE